MVRVAAHPFHDDACAVTMPSGHASSRRLPHGWARFKFTCPCSTGALVCSSQTVCETIVSGFCTARCEEENAGGNVHNFMVSMNRYSSGSQDDPSLTDVAGDLRNSKPGPPSSFHRALVGPRAALVPAMPQKSVHTFTWTSASPDRAARGCPL